MKLLEDRVDFGNEVAASSRKLAINSARVLWREHPGSERGKRLTKHSSCNSARRSLSKRIGKSRTSFVASVIVPTRVNLPSFSAAGQQDTGTVSVMSSSATTADGQSGATTTAGPAGPAREDLHASMRASNSTRSEGGSARRETAKSNTAARKTTPSTSSLTFGKEPGKETVAGRMLGAGLRATSICTT